MANPYYGEVRPLGWAPVSNKLPSAIFRGQLVNNAQDAEARGRFDFIRGPVFRGDANSLTLRVAPLMRRMARFTAPTYRGEVREVENAPIQR